MTDWRQMGWCDVCEITLDNGAPGDGVICAKCGFDSRKAQEQREAEKLVPVEVVCDETNNTSEDERAGIVNVGIVINHRRIVGS